MSSLRLALFIDAQNFYRSARRSFFTLSGNTYGSVCGQFKPMEIGKLISQRAKADLCEVRIYTGRPVADKEPKTYSANMKQCSTWEKEGVTVIHRSLRYPHDWPNSKPSEKGIDVALTVDFVAMGIDKQYDIGIIASIDTDLVPALEYVHHKCGNNCSVGVTAWDGSNRLRIKGGNIPCYWLKQADYDAVADQTSYSS